MSSSFQVCTTPSVGVVPTIVQELVSNILLLQCAISPPELWPEDYGPIFMNAGFLEYDYVVIGAGTAGSVVASRLSEDPNNKVLVLEAGGDPPMESEVPATFYTVERTEYNWNYFTEPNENYCRGFINGSCYWPRGKMIGGSGGINAMLYVIGNRNDYDDWGNDNPTWSWNDVLPVFQESIAIGKNVSDKRGGLNINPFNKSYQPIRDMIFSGASSLGVMKGVFDKGEAVTGFTEQNGFYGNGRRQSTGKSYLRKAKDRENLDVIKYAVATKIILNDAGTIATGVEFIYKSEHKLTVKVRKEVIVSAGTLGSPKLLMLSGIGPQHHLQSFSIKVVRDLPVGNNLQDHNLIPLFFNISNKDVEAETPQQNLDAMYEYLVHNKGSLASHGVSDIIGFVNTSSRFSQHPDVLFHHLMLPQGSKALNVFTSAIGFNDDVIQSLEAALYQTHLMGALVLLLKPKSKGTVRLTSANPMDPIKIVPNYFAEKSDIDTLVRGLNFQVNLESTYAYRNQQAKIHRLPLPECDRFTFKSNDYWKCYQKYLGTTMYHPCGTVKMGKVTDPSTVVDSQLRVHGISGLRVIDASIMPTIVSGNINAPTVMIAEKGAKFIMN